ncbi:hypothetical protein PVK06_012980 [Gossypium arboreum]|uniref:Fibronectin type III-like domain-containing protein n=1 Tax=Gossypium arboreum TaxID=29729 RepID=A0ABR0QD96_GOSAR|nr:hypothetical protein PVK06_012980 [Gossypium arboreum]
MISNYAGVLCQYTSPLQGLQKYVSMVIHEVGCRDVKCNNDTFIDLMVQAAANVDAMLLIMGLDKLIEVEGLDRVNLTLPGYQDKLMIDVANASNGKVVLVVMAAGPIDITFARNMRKIGAILWVGYPGQAGGDAIAQKPPSTKVVTGAPNMQLIGFERVGVKKGKTKYVATSLNVCKDLSLVDVEGKRKLVIEQHTIFVGTTSEHQVRHHFIVRQAGDKSGEPLVSIT